MVSDPRAKLIKLVGVLADLDEKRSAVMAEITEVLGGGEGIGAKLSRLKATFSELWQAAYRSGPYEFDHKVDTGHLKRFLKTHSEDEIAARMVSYLRTNDQFYVKARHNFPIFVRSFNTLVGIPADHLNGDHSAALTSEKMRGLRGE